MFKKIIKYIRTVLLGYTTPHCIGVDISSTSIKLVDLIQESFKINYHYISNIQSSKISKDTFDDIDYIAKLLKTSYRLSGITNKDIAFAIPQNLTITKEFTLPLIKNKIKLDEQVRMFLEKELNDGDFEFDYQITNKTRQNIDVTAVLARKDKIEEYYALAQLSELDLSVIDIYSYAIINCLEKLFKVSSKVTNKNIVVFDMQINKLGVYYFIDKKYISHLEITTNYLEQILPILREFKIIDIAKNQLFEIIKLVNDEKINQVDFIGMVYNDIIRIMQLLRSNLMTDKNIILEDVEQVVLFGINSLSTKLETSIHNYFVDAEILNVSQLLKEYNPKMELTDLALLFPAISLAIRGNGID